MTCFSDQIKNALKSFVIKLYEIAKQYSFMSLTRVEESMGLSPITYKQDLLGSRDSQGKEPAPDEATKTQTAFSLVSVISFHMVPIKPSGRRGMKSRNWRPNRAMAGDVRVSLSGVWQYCNIA